MRSDTLIQREQLFLFTAVIAAHSTFNRQGFRQRDLRFYIELFSNWAESSIRNSSLKIQNTQVSRFLDFLVNEGYARRIERTSSPLYRLTRTGLLECISKIVYRNYISERSNFLFLYYFIKNYKPRIQNLVESEGKEFPPALKIELETLLNHQALLKRELENIEQSIKHLKIRISDAKNTVDLVKSSKAPIEIIVFELEKQFPYELNSQKPLSELIGQIPADQRRWELCDGNIMRQKEIWEPELRMLLMYQEEVKKLLS